MTLGLDSFLTMMDRGGPVMWPLLLLSLVSLAMILDRAIFWHSVHSRARRIKLARLCDALRAADRAKVTALTEDDRSPYARVAAAIADATTIDAVAMEAVERERPRLDRFMMAFSTIITAAPMFGILGTVLGIIQSFRLMGDASMLTDPRQLSGGIAEALLTTAAGLTVAIITLFPYMFFRAQVERAIGRMEIVIASARQGATAALEARRSTSMTIEPRAERAPTLAR